MHDYSKHIGLDVHKATIAVAIAAIEGPAMTYGTISNTPASITKMVKKLTAGGEVAAFCYEAVRADTRFIGRSPRWDMPV